MLLCRVDGLVVFVSEDGWEENAFCGDKSGAALLSVQRPGSLDASMINSSKQIPHCPAASCEIVYQGAWEEGGEARATGRSDKEAMNEEAAA